MNEQDLPVNCSQDTSAAHCANYGDACDDFCYPVLLTAKQPTSPCPSSSDVCIGLCDGRMVCAADTLVTCPARKRHELDDSDDDEEEDYEQGGFAPPKPKL